MIDWPEVTRGKGSTRPIQRSQANIRAFLDARGITLQHNAHQCRDEIVRNGRDAQPLDDATLRELRLAPDDEGLSPRSEFFNDVLFNEARRNTYHPVLNYIERLEWDGRDRLDRLAADYFGAADTALNQQIMRSTMIAGVRRIRVPGSKFDNLPVIEGAQGAGKSSAVKALAGEHWFSDSLNIGSDPRETIELTRGKWICELSELVGLGKKDRERVKAFLSRSVDSARMSYQRLPIDAPRQFILIGTSNSTEYLTDTTGNRRFWPIRIGKVNLDAIHRDRDQLWAEAAYHEASGESTELPPELWADAEAAQEKRLSAEPWLDLISAQIGEKRCIIRASAVWDFLGIDASRQDPHMAARIGDVMRRLGFEKDRKRPPAGANPVSCFIRQGESSTWLDLPKGGRP